MDTDGSNVINLTHNPAATPERQSRSSWSDSVHSVPTVQATFTVMPPNPARLDPLSMSDLTPYSPSGPWLRRHPRISPCRCHEANRGALTDRRQAEQG
jgi:hypothetical protein